MKYEKNQWKEVSKSPGIYQFFGREGVLLYIGKAKNLKNRIAQYFTGFTLLTEKTKILVSKIESIETIETESEFDALLLEAELIRTKKPKYNILSRDDKSPLYVLLTLSEELPHVYFVRKRGGLNNYHIRKKDVLFGPFQSARLTRSLLRSLRSIIPFCTQKRRNGRACFSSHIGLCAPCPSFIIGMEGDKKKSGMRSYRKNIYALRNILSGRSDIVRREFLRNMKKCSDSFNFEEALTIRRHIDALDLLRQKSFDPSLYLGTDETMSDQFETQTESAIALLASFGITLRSLHRIECIDISNTQGTNASGAVTVLIDGRNRPDEYRKFRIRSDNIPDDFRMVGEVMRRRLGHPEWPYPDLFVIDGGKGQMQSALSVLNQSGLMVPLLGLAKRNETLLYYNSDTQTYKSITLPFTSPALQLFQRIRDEAHRFSKSYHIHLRTRSMTRALSKSGKFASIGG